MLTRYHVSVLTRFAIISPSYVNMEAIILIDLMAASKRKDPEYQQISGYVPKHLALKFKGFCTMEELEISEVLTALIAGWVKEREEKPTSTEAK